MGGDHGPSVVIPAAAIALVRHPDMRFLLVGDRASIAPELEAHPALAAKSELIHTEVAVAMDAKPSQALRKGRYHSSMWLSARGGKRRARRRGRVGRQYRRADGHGEVLPEDA